MIFNHEKLNVYQRSAYRIEVGLNYDTVDKEHDKAHDKENRQLLCRNPCRNPCREPCRKLCRS